MRLLRGSPLRAITVAIGMTLAGCGHSSSETRGSLTAPETLQFCSALAGAGNALETARGTVGVDQRRPLYRAYVDLSLTLVAAAPPELAPHVTMYRRWFTAFGTALEAHDYDVDAALVDADFAAVDADASVVAALKGFSDYRTAKCTSTAPVTAATRAS
jgi:hypothetical protein